MKDRALEEELCRNEVTVGGEEEEEEEELVGGDVGGAAAVAGGGLSSLDVEVEQLHLQEGNSHIFLRGNRANAGGGGAYLAAGQLGQVRLQLLPDHRVDGHQAEDAGLPHAALRVVVALQRHGGRQASLEGGGAGEERGRVGGLTCSSPGMMSDSS